MPAFPVLMKMCGEKYGMFCATSAQLYILQGEFVIKSISRTISFLICALFFQANIISIDGNRVNFVNYHL